MNLTVSDKIRLHLRLTPETRQLIDEYEKKDNCTTTNEFVEHAVEFYVGYLSAEDCLRFLPPTLAAAVRGTVRMPAHPNRANLLTTRELKRLLKWRLNL